MTLLITDDRMGLNRRLDSRFGEPDGEWFRVRQWSIAGLEVTALQR
jgi:hypothetical protein